MTCYLVTKPKSRHGRLLAAPCCPWPRGEQLLCTLGLPRGGAGGCQENGSLLCPLPDATSPGTVSAASRCHTTVPTSRMAAVLIQHPRSLSTFAIPSVGTPLQNNLCKTKCRVFGSEPNHIGVLQGQLQPLLASNQDLLDLVALVDTSP